MTDNIYEAACADTFFDWLPEPYCIGCRHYRSMHGYARRGRVCHYLLDTGHSRGCPFGRGCPHR